MTYNKFSQTQLHFSNFVNYIKIISKITLELNLQKNNKIIHIKYHQNIFNIIISKCTHSIFYTYIQFISKFIIEEKKITAPDKICLKNTNQTLMMKAEGGGGDDVSDLHQMTYFCQNILEILFLVHTNNNKNNNCYYFKEEKVYITTFIQ